MRTLKREQNLRTNGMKYAQGLAIFIFNINEVFPFFLNIPEFRETLHFKHALPGTQKPFSLNMQHKR